MAPSQVVSMPLTLSQYKMTAVSASMILVRVIVDHLDAPPADHMISRLGTILLGAQSSR